MRKAKIAVTIDEKIVDRLDGLVHQRAFANRSQAVEQALLEKLERIDRIRLAREAAKVNVDEERSLAEEGIDRDGAEWPAY
jgi:metal-responsive CopG/Arc/MetJ family transcriptional regulator